MKPVRHKITEATAPPNSENGLWRYWIKLSCGHKQFYGATRYGKLPKTTICHACSKQ